MPRPPRIIDPEGFYHVYCRGNNKSRLFHTARDYERFMEALYEAKRKYDFSLFHYCLMPNHFHLLLRPNSRKLPDVMHDVKLEYARYFAGKYAHSGHVWQGRYKHKHIKSDAQLFACGNYIEMNPVRAKMEARPEDWQYTSYRHYAFGERTRLVDTDPLYATLGRDADERRYQYQKYVNRTRASVLVPGTKTVFGARYRGRM